MYVIVAGLGGGGPAWEHLSETVLASYASGTALLLVLTGLLILAFAVPAAWIVTTHEFPGRGAFEWLLILPLAAPGYVLAYAWADLMGVGGPVQEALRALTGLRARDYWFPDIHSLPGLAFVLACGLYPYVYLTARSAFVAQSACSLEAARSLSASAHERFWRVALPAARPAIAAGLLLALMEAAADYGAAEHLGVPTLTFGIVRAWKSFGEPGIAARLALSLVALSAVLMFLELKARGRSLTANGARRWRPLARARLSGWQAAAASGGCALLLLAAFVLPIGHLALTAAAAPPGVAPLQAAIMNSLLLAGAGAGLAFLLAVAIALGIRQGGTVAQFARVVAMSGYAIPGAVLALGALAALSSAGLKLAGGTALLALAWVYACRFTAAGSEPIAAALAKAPPSVALAARSLGAPPLRRILTIDLPLALPGASAAALILFIEALKELPATLMLRPFDWDTLAVRAHAYASDERLASAALPALLITAAGLVPVILLSRQLNAGRPEHTA